MQIPTAGNHVVHDENVMLRRGRIRPAKMSVRRNDRLKSRTDQIALPTFARPSVPLSRRGVSAGMETRPRIGLPPR